MSVRVRIAPSPTGNPHIGTAWQALFDYVFAKKNNGKFIFRLEDTDRERLVPGSVEVIKETLNWLELPYDEGPDKDGGFGPYVQSERIEIYKKYADELLEKGLAYKDEGAIRFKVAKEGETSWTDLIGNKKITFKNETQEDFVILKTDGYPTYNFANVIDDHLMEISHVIRGNEFVSSTPKHLMLYQAFGWTPPEFAHLPVLVGADRSKLSKRHGAKSALEFRDEGFLREAILNFLALLGWTHPEGREIFSLEEMIQVFDLKDFNSASAYFDITKLEWMNGEYIRKMSDEELAKRLEEFLPDHPGKGKILQLVPLVKERIKKLSDFVPLTNFFFYPPEYDLSPFKKLKIGGNEPKVKKTLEEVLKVLEGLEKPWKAQAFEESLKKYAQEEELTNFDVFQLIRIAVSGQLVTPPLFESIEILGEEETLKRVKHVSEKYPDFPDEAKDLDIETSG